MKVLLVGHLTQDVRGDDASDASLWSWGGSVYYCARTYALMGFEVHVVTSVGEGVGAVRGWLPGGVCWHVFQGEETTRFVNRYDGHGQRRQEIESVGPLLLPDDVMRELPDEVDVLHLCPVFGEVPLVPWVNGVKAGQVILGAQGMLRGRRAGVVIPRVWSYWDDLSVVAGRVHGVFVSEEDVVHQQGLVDALRLQVPIVVRTQGVLGGWVYEGSERHRIETYPVEAIDPTGAGDVFAAAFTASRSLGATLDEASRAGAAAASLVIEAPGIVGMLSWRQQFHTRVLSLVDGSMRLRRTST